MLSKHKLLIFILALGLILRFISLNQSFWLDEAITALQTRYSFYHYFYQFAPSDFHPPFYYLIIKFWSLLLPPTEISLRLPSVIFALLTIIAVYSIAKNLKLQSTTSFLAIILLATAPLHIYYSQEARMYSQAVFFASLSILFFIKSQQDKILTNQLIFIFSTTMMLLTHYLTITLLPVFIIMAKNRRHTFSNLGISTLFFLPWLPWLLKQLNTGAGSINLGWGTILGKPTFKNIALVPVKFLLGRISIDNNLVYTTIIFPIFLFYLWLIYLAVKNNYSKSKLLIFWLIFPSIITFFISYIFPMLSYFRLLFSLPAMYLLAATGYTSIKNASLKNITFLVLLLVNFFSIYFYFSRSQFHREDWRNAINFVESRNGAALFAFSEPPAPWQWYANPKTPVFTTQTGLLTDQQQLQDCCQHLLGQKEIIVFEYLQDLTDPNRLIFVWLESNGFTKIGSKSFTGLSQLYVYQKMPSLALIK